MAQEQGIFNLHKRAGETPLECLRRFKAGHPEHYQTPMTYVGRLDPLAEGVLLVLGGEARFRREEFLDLGKEYEMEVLWGFASDSHDPLGLVEFVGDPEGIDARIDGALGDFRGEVVQSYPAFSSRTLGGVPLFQLAREGKLGEAPMPSKLVKIDQLEAFDSYELTGGDILIEAGQVIGRVRGDFRQDEAMRSWRKAVLGRESRKFPISSLRARVSSGTYMRVLAEMLGKKLGCGALAWRIKRISVGDFKIADSAA